MHKCVLHLFRGLANTEFGVPLEQHLGNLCCRSFKTFSASFDELLRRLGNRQARELPSTGSVRRRAIGLQRTMYVDMKPFTRASITAKFKAHINVEKIELQLVEGLAVLLSGINLQTCRAAYSADSMKKNTK